MKNESGIFMLEAMVSLVLLALGAIVVSETFPAGGRLERSSREAFVSSLRVQSLLRDVDGFAPQRDGIQEGTFFDGSQDRWKATVSESEDRGLYKVRLELTDAKGRPLPGGRVETLTADWSAEA